VLVGDALFGIQARKKQSQQLAGTTKSLEVQTVNVIHPRRGQSSSDLALPGMIRAFSQSPIYARVDGYVRAWHTDIGARVTKGQLLAEIDAPEVDQQLNQARAMLNQAETSLALAKVTAPRYQELIKPNYVSQQEVDQNNQNLAAQQANVQAATAAVNRLEQMQRFENIVAPFDGPITQRFMAVGALVPVDGSKIIFTIIQDNVLRIQVDVPQTYAAEMREQFGAPVRVVASVAEAVRGAGVVCTVTASETPVLEGRWLAPGTHINAVGAARPEWRELDTDTVVCSRLFVDSRAGAVVEAGDIVGPLRDGAITAAHIQAEIGEVFAGRHPGRTTSEEITLFKSLGMAVEDVATARFAYLRALARGIGDDLTLE